MIVTYVVEVDQVEEDADLQIITTLVKASIEKTFPFNDVTVELVD